MICHLERKIKRFFRLKRAIVSVVLCGAYLYTNVIGVYASESNFWAERRQSAKRFQKKQPSSQGQHLQRTSSNINRGKLTPEQYQLIAQLPLATNFNFGTTNHIPVTGNISKATASFTSDDLKSGVKGNKKGNISSKDAPTWLSSLVLPYGAIRDIYLSKTPDSPLIIHIQDAHDIEDAQRNMASLIQGLKEERGISLVGLEGAEGAFALEAYRSYPNVDVLKGVADYLLAEGDIGGPEYYGLTASTPPILWGVEDLRQYETNIQAFKDSVKYKPAVHEFLKELKTASKVLKKMAYSSSLQQFDGHFNAYKEGKEDLGTYLKFLMDTHRGSKLLYTNIHILLNALSWEQRLDFKKVEKDRLRLVEVMAKNLAEDQLNHLVQQSLSYRMGQMTYGSYYRFLRKLCRKNGISLEKYNQLNTYITYVLLAEKINRNDLLVEMDKLEQATQNFLARTTAQQRLVNINRHLILLEKLTNHKMAPSDWLYYLDHKKDILGVGLELKVVALSMDTPFPPKTPEGFSEMIEPFENFCLYAMERNNSLVKNLLTKMDTSKTKTAVLVAGGFHTEGLTQILRREDVSHVVITPKINEIPEGNRGLDVLARDPIPLEKLFSGEIINLVTPRRTALSNRGPLIDRFKGMMASLPVSLKNSVTKGQANLKKAVDYAKRIGIQSIQITRGKFREGLYYVLNFTFALEGRTKTYFSTFTTSQNQLSVAKGFAIKDGLPEKVIDQMTVLGHITQYIPWKGDGNIFRGIRQWVGKTFSPRDPPEDSSFDSSVLATTGSSVWVARRLLSLRKWLKLNNPFYRLNLNSIDKRVSQEQSRYYLNQHAQSSEEEIVAFAAKYIAPWLEPFQGIGVLYIIFSLFNVEAPFAWASSLFLLFFPLMHWKGVYVIDEFSGDPVFKKFNTSFFKDPMGWFQERGGPWGKLFVAGLIYYLPFVVEALLTSSVSSWTYLTVFWVLFSHGALFNTSKLRGIESKWLQWLKWFPLSVSGEGGDGDSGGSQEDPDETERRNQSILETVRLAYDQFEKRNKDITGFSTTSAQNSDQWGIFFISGVFYEPLAKDSLDATLGFINSWLKKNPKAVVFTHDLMDILYSGMEGALSKDPQTNERVKAALQEQTILSQRVLEAYREKRTDNESDSEMMEWVKNFNDLLRGIPHKASLFKDAWVEIREKKDPYRSADHFMRAIGGIIDKNKTNLYGPPDSWWSQLFFGKKKEQDWKQAYRSLKEPLRKLIKVSWEGYQKKASYFLLGIDSAIAQSPLPFYFEGDSFSKIFKNPDIQKAFDDPLPFITLSIQAVQTALEQKQDQKQKRNDDVFVHPIAIVDLVIQLTLLQKEGVKNFEEVVSSLEKELDNLSRIHRELFDKLQSFAFLNPQHLGEHGSWEWEYRIFENIEKIGFIAGAMSLQRGNVQLFTDIEIRAYDKEIGSQSIDKYLRNISWLYREEKNENKDRFSSALPSVQNIQNQGNFLQPGEEEPIPDFDTFIEELKAASLKGYWPLLIQKDGHQVNVPHAIINKNEGMTTERAFVICRAVLPDQLDPSLWENIIKEKVLSRLKDFQRAKKLIDRGNKRAVQVFLYSLYEGSDVLIAMAHIEKMLSHFKEGKDPLKLWKDNSTSWEQSKNQEFSYSLGDPWPSFETREAYVVEGTEGWKGFRSWRNYNYYILLCAVVDGLSVWRVDDRDFAEEILKAEKTFNLSQSMEEFVKVTAKHKEGLYRNVNPQALLFREWFMLYKQNIISPFEISLMAIKEEFQKQSFDRDSFEYELENFLRISRRFMLFQILFDFMENGNPKKLDKAWEKAISSHGKESILGLKRGGKAYSAAFSELNNTLTYSPIKEWLERLPASSFPSSDLRDLIKIYRNYREKIGWESKDPADLTSKEWREMYKKLSKQLLACIKEIDDEWIITKNSPLFTELQDYVITFRALRELVNLIDNKEEDVLRSASLPLGSAFQKPSLRLVKSDRKDSPPSDSQSSAPNVVPISVAKNQKFPIRKKTPLSPLDYSFKKRSLFDLFLSYFSDPMDSFYLKKVSEYYAYFSEANQGTSNFKHEKFKQNLWEKYFRVLFSDKPVDLKNIEQAYNQVEYMRKEYAKSDIHPDRLMSLVSRVALLEPDRRIEYLNNIFPLISEEKSREEVFWSWDLFPGGIAKTIAAAFISLGGVFFFLTLYSMASVPGDTPDISLLLKNLFIFVVIPSVVTFGLGYYTLRRLKKRRTHLEKLIKDIVNDYVLEKEDEHLRGPLMQYWFDLLTPFVLNSSKNLDYFDTVFKNAQEKIKGKNINFLKRVMFEIETTLKNDLQPQKKKTDESEERGIRKELEAAFNRLINRNYKLSTLLSESYDSYLVNILTRDFISKGVSAKVVTHVLDFLKEQLDAESHLIVPLGGIEEGFVWLIQEAVHKQFQWRRETFIKKEIEKIKINRIGRLLQAAYEKYSEAKKPDIKRDDNDLILKLSQISGGEFLLQEAFESSDRNYAPGESDYMKDVLKTLSEELKSRSRGTPWALPSTEAILDEWERAPGFFKRILASRRFFSLGRFLGVSIIEEPQLVGLFSRDIKIKRRKGDPALYLYDVTVGGHQFPVACKILGQNQYQIKIEGAPQGEGALIFKLEENAGNPVIHVTSINGISARYNYPPGDVRALLMVLMKEVVGGGSSFVGELLPGEVPVLIELRSTHKEALNRLLTEKIIPSMDDLARYVSLFGLRGMDYTWIFDKSHLDIHITIQSSSRKDGSSLLTNPKIFKSQEYSHYLKNVPHRKRGFKDVYDEVQAFPTEKNFHKTQPFSLVERIKISRVPAMVGGIALAALHLGAGLDLIWAVPMAVASAVALTLTIQRRYVDLHGPQSNRQFWVRLLATFLFNLSALGVPSLVFLVVDVASFWEVFSFAGIPAAIGAPFLMHIFWNLLISFLEVMGWVEKNRYHMTIGTLPPTGGDNPFPDFDAFFQKIREANDQGNWPYSEHGNVLQTILDTYEKMTMEQAFVIYGAVLDELGLPKKRPDELFTKQWKEIIGYGVLPYIEDFEVAKKLMDRGNERSVQVFLHSLFLKSDTFAALAHVSRMVSKNPLENQKIWNNTKNQKPLRPLGDPWPPFETQEKEKWDDFRLWHNSRYYLFMRSVVNGLGVWIVDDRDIAEEILKKERELIFNQIKEGELTFDQIMEQFVHATGSGSYGGLYRNVSPRALLIREWIAFHGEHVENVLTSLSSHPRDEWMSLAESNPPYFQGLLENFLLQSPPIISLYILINSMGKMGKKNLKQLDLSWEKAMAPRWEASVLGAEQGKAYSEAFSQLNALEYAPIKNWLITLYDPSPMPDHLRRSVFIYRDYREKIGWDEKDPADLTKKEWQDLHKKLSGQLLACIKKIRYYRAPSDDFHALFEELKKHVITFRSLRELVNVVDDKAIETLKRVSEFPEPKIIPFSRRVFSIGENPPSPLDYSFKKRAFFDLILSYFSKPIDSFFLEKVPEYYAHFSEENKEAPDSQQEKFKQNLWKEYFRVLFSDKPVDLKNIKEAYDLVASMRKKYAKFDIHPDRLMLLVYRVALLEPDRRIEYLNSIFPLFLVKDNRNVEESHKEVFWSRNLFPGGIAKTIAAAFISLAGVFAFLTLYAIASVPGDIPDIPLLLGDLFIFVGTPLVITIGLIYYKLRKLEKRRTHLEELIKKIVNDYVQEEENEHLRGDLMQYWFDLFTPFVLNSSKELSYFDTVFKNAQTKSTGKTTPFLKRMMYEIETILRNDLQSQKKKIDGSKEDEVRKKLSEAFNHFIKENNIKRDHPIFDLYGEENNEHYSSALVNNLANDFISKDVSVETVDHVLGFLRKQMEAELYLIVPVGGIEIDEGLVWMIENAVKKGEWRREKFLKKEIEKIKISRIGQRIQNVYEKYSPGHKKSLSLEDNDLIIKLSKIFDGELLLKEAIEDLESEIIFDKNNFMVYVRKRLDENFNETTPWARPSTEAILDEWEKASGILGFFKRRLASRRSFGLGRFLGIAIIEDYQIFSQNTESIKEKNTVTHFSPKGSKEEMKDGSTIYYEPSRDEFETHYKVKVGEDRFTVSYARIGPIRYKLSISNRNREGGSFFFNLNIEDQNKPKISIEATDLNEALSDDTVWPLLNVLIEVIAKGKEPLYIRSFQRDSVPQTKGKEVKESPEKITKIGKLSVSLSLDEESRDRLNILLMENPAPSMADLEKNVPIFGFKGMDYSLRFNYPEVILTLTPNPHGKKGTRLLNSWVFEKSEYQNYVGRLELEYLKAKPPTDFSLNPVSFEAESKPLPSLERLKISRIPAMVGGIILAALQVAGVDLFWAVVPLASVSAGILTVMQRRYVDLHGPQSAHQYWVRLLGTFLLNLSALLSPVLLGDSWVSVVVLALSAPILVHIIWNWVAYYRYPDYVLTIKSEKEDGSPRASQEDPKEGPPVFHGREGSGLWKRAWILPDQALKFITLNVVEKIVGVMNQVAEGTEFFDFFDNLKSSINQTKKDGLQEGSEKEKDFIEEISQALRESPVPLILPQEVVAAVVKAANMSLISDDFVKTLQQVLLETKIDEEIFGESVSLHILNGHALPSPGSRHLDHTYEKALEEWEKDLAYFSRGPDGQLHLYIHETVYNSWKIIDSNEEMDSDTQKDFAKNVLKLIFSRALAQNRGVPVKFFKRLGLDVEGLLALYKKRNLSSEDLENIDRRVDLIGRLPLSIGASSQSLETAVEEMNWSSDDKKQIVLDSMPKILSKPLVHTLGITPFLLELNEEDRLEQKKMYLDFTRHFKFSGSPRREWPIFDNKLTDALELPKEDRAEKVIEMIGNLTDSLGIHFRENLANNIFKGIKVLLETNEGDLPKVDEFKILFQEMEKKMAFLHSMGGVVSRLEWKSSRDDEEMARVDAQKSDLIWLHQLPFVLGYLGESFGDGPQDSIQWLSERAESYNQMRRQSLPFTSPFEAAKKISEQEGDIIINLPAKMFKSGRLFPPSERSHLNVIRELATQLPLLGKNQKIIFVTHGADKVKKSALRDIFFSQKNKVLPGRNSDKLKNQALSDFIERSEIVYAKDIDGFRKKEEGKTVFYIDKLIRKSGVRSEGLYVFTPKEKNVEWVVPESLKETVNLIISYAGDILINQTLKINEAFEEIKFLLIQA